MPDLYPEACIPHGWSVSCCRKNNAKWLLPQCHDIISMGDPEVVSHHYRVFAQTYSNVMSFLDSPPKLHHTIDVIVPSMVPTFQSPTGCQPSTGNPRISRFVTYDKPHLKILTKLAVESVFILKNYISYCFKEGFKA